MIEFRPLASSSAGNCYVVKSGDSTLLLEAGVPIKDIRKAVWFNLSGVDGCMVTHEHQDHARSVEDVMRSGVDVYMSHGTRAALGLELHHRAHGLRPRETVEIGKWTILPFETEHDAAEPFGFLIADGTGDKLLYATDTYYIRYRFRGLTHIAIEMNYSIEILNENIMAGRVPAAMKPRLLRSHMSLETVKGFLTANDLSQVREIWLLHLSDTNSDAERFKREVQALTGKLVFIAER